MNVVEPDIATRQADGIQRSVRRTALPVFIFTLWVLLTAGPAAAEQRLALVVGNSAYQGITELDKPKNDATLILGALQGIGFTLVGGQAAPQQPQQAPDGPSGRSGGYVVLVSSQRTEENAQAFYKALQSRFPNVLGSRAPIIKRADLGHNGLSYHAVVGPFDTTDEAAQFCGSLRTAGGFCVVQKNF